MTLEEALNAAIREIGRAQMERYNSMQAQVDLREAAAVLREFMEKGLPFYRAAEKHFAGERNYASVIDAYRAMKEG